MKQSNPKQASFIVATELERMKYRIIANMYSAKAVATGNTIRSLKVIPRTDGASLISDQQMPFGVLETGRRGGKVPRGFADIIYAWMQVKGVHAQGADEPQEQADRSMAFAIARKIAKSGTRLYRLGGRSGIYSNEIPETLQRINERVSEFVQTIVLEQIQLNNLQ